VLSSRQVARRCVNRTGVSDGQHAGVYRVLEAVDEVDSVLGPRQNLTTATQLKSGSDT